MPLYRATIRYTAAGQQYDVLDLTANSLREAMRVAADRFPEAATSSADLIEIRLQARDESMADEPMVADEG